MALLINDKQDFKLDLTTGDLDLSGGRLNLSSGQAGVAQGAMIRAKQIKGEWFLDQLKGVAYIEVKGIVTAQEALLGKPLDRAQFEAALRDVLAASPGVLEVVLLEVTQNKRTRTVRSRWQLRTAFGDTPVQTLEH